ncbi:MAG: pyrroloquinoline quinone biosynthesis peptide chaperone PqqD [Burkholderiales bacterium]|nr:pyrroloquinoline quinone biosynthesis peptide chaperone PqqD [Burkholderiales bacterium]
MSEASMNSCPRIRPGLRLQWEPAQDCHVLLYPEGMVKLNGSAGEIMHRLDGVKTAQDVVEELELAFGSTGLARDVLDFLAMAQQQGWVKS